MEEAIIVQKRNSLPVIIVTMGGSACERLIALLKAGIRVFPIVVLNGYSETVIARFRSLIGSDGELIVLSRNLGGSGGFRAGMSYVLQHYSDIQRVWLLDDDAEINRDTLSELLRTADQFEKENIPWGVLGSMIVSAEQRDIVIETGASIDLKKGGFLLKNHGKKCSEIPKIPIPCQYCAAASLLTRVEVLRMAGIFADIFIHFDDVEWCFRVRNAGYNVYCVPSSAIHHPSHLSKPATWIRYYDAANYIWFCKKYFPKSVKRAVFQQWLKAFYFYLHGFKATARLYYLGIRDGLAGNVRLHRDELIFEPYVSVSSDEWVQEKLFITDLPCHGIEFCRRFGENTKIILLGKSWVKRIFYGMFANLLIFFSPGKIVVLDDRFRNKKMLPLIGKNVFCYNIELNMKVER